MSGINKPSAGSGPNTNTKQMRLKIRCKSNNLVKDQLGSFSPSGRLNGQLKFNFIPGIGGTKRDLL